MRTIAPGSRRPVAHILPDVGEPAEPKLIAPALGPPAWDDAPEPMPDWDLIAAPDPSFEIDQRICW